MTTPRALGTVLIFAHLFQTTFLPLFGVLPKLVVSLVFLYVLLGWAAFVALGAIIAFAPVSRAVSKKYGGVQEEIMKVNLATARHLRHL